MPSDGIPTTAAQDPAATGAASKLSSRDVEPATDTVVPRRSPPSAANGAATGSVLPSAAADPRSPARAVALVDHPKNICLPEAALMEPLNSYIHRAFSEDQRDATVDAMLGVAGDVNVNPQRMADAQRRLTQAKTRLARLTQAIEAGADLEALIEPLNRAREERDAAAEELERTPAGSELVRADVEALVDSLADAGRQVISASPARLQELYEEIGLELVYNAKERMVAVTIRPPRRVNTCVRGGT
ncbi:hypothetical protein F9C11_29665 [Amycolatopsis sp. VS8301801F10]|uniref:hypothetical protein n=1 Tax=Amycolatopsis sp. VS8301801F10 TaxID=2652442 RepID=UPI0038FD0F1C